MNNIQYHDQKNVAIATNGGGMRMSCLQGKVPRLSSVQCAAGKTAPECTMPEVRSS